ncbi:MAG: SCO6880 family protein [Solirubrobacteraceae bacterium]
MSERTSPPRTYRFGEMERAGLVGGLRTSQATVIGVCTVLAFLTLLTLGARDGGLALVVVLALGAIALIGAFAPVGGQPLCDWALPTLRYLRKGKRGRVWIAGAPATGAYSEADVMELPGELAHCELLGAPLRGGEVGIMADRSEGTYTATLAVKVAAFGLLSADEQERRLERWGMVLASLGREGSPIHRIQWIERSVPTDGDELGRYLAEARDQTIPLHARSIASYIDLCDSAGEVTQDHELFLCVQISAARARTAIKRNGGGDDGACSVLCDRLQMLAEQLTAAQIGVRGALRPQALAKVLRVAYDPYGRVGLARAAARNADGDGIAPAAAGPMATREQWGSYQTDGAWHATYWIASWPHVEVPAIWMMPLLTQGGALRAVSVVMEPLSLRKATREAEAARTSDLEEEHWRSEHGFTRSARTERRQRANIRREAELAAGHAELRMTGYVTVSGRTVEELELACERMEQSATQSHLELRRLYGQQAQTFAFTLPLGEGLA